jgi:hypothetical protein
MEEEFYAWSIHTGEIEEFLPLFDDEEFQDDIAQQRVSDKYLCALSNKRFDLHTARLRTLGSIMNRFLPGYSSLCKATDVPTIERIDLSNAVKSAMNRMIVAACGQTERICNSDLPL